MFHLSLPVRNFDACLAFYRECFGAQVQMLRPGVANLFVFGGQLTLHDRASCTVADEMRRDMHFGQVVTPVEWVQARDTITASGYVLLSALPPGHGPKGRGKLLILDPSGNLVEINSEAIGG